MANGREPKRVQVADKDAGQRLDRWLKALFSTVPYVAVQKMIRQGRVRVNGEKIKPDVRVVAGDSVSFPPDVEAREGRAAGQGALQVSVADVKMIEKALLFEDPWVMVLNKPAGLPAQAGGGQVRSLDRILAGMFGEEKAPKLVHRLDRETTGLMVCAKNRSTAAALSAQFAGREIEKVYLALVTGVVKGEKGKIEKPIKKVGPIAKVAADGERAVTTWKVRARISDTLTLLECTPHTGRMNQLRVHFADAGFPIVGDDKYEFARARAAGKALGVKGEPLYLHAWKLGFVHPQSGEKVAFEAPLPAHFAALQS